MGLGAGATASDELPALAQVDPQASQITDTWGGGTDVTLSLSQGVPFRVFVVDAPPRLVVDFREADWSGIKTTDLLDEPGRVSGIRFGTFQPGWSRLVADLTGPMLPGDIAMILDKDTGQARLEMSLSAADPKDFAAQAGVPKDVSWPRSDEKQPPIAPIEDGKFIVAIDPGHGGIDPGAERDGIVEKNLMLDMAQELRKVLLRSGQVEVVLTREEDIFVSLEKRVALAHRAGADAFLSLHADILTQGGAKGATIYTLSNEASDKATEYLAARHNRADIIAGADLTGADDQVAGVLLDLARQETKPRSGMLADALAAKMSDAGGPMNRHPRREAGFSVLKSADIPSVLIEVGFLSNQRDVDNLADPVWRAIMVNAMADAILDWRKKDLARQSLLRQ